MPGRVTDGLLVTSPRSERMELVAACVSDGDVLSALTELEAIIDDHPHYAPAYFAAGKILLSQHELCRAENYLSIASTLDPGDGELQLALGQSLRANGRHRQAITPLRQAVGLLDANASAWRELAEALQLSGHLDDARRSFDVVRGLIAPNARPSSTRSYQRASSPTRSSPRAHQLRAEPKFDWSH